MARRRDRVRQAAKELVAYDGLRGIGDVAPWHEIVPRLWMGSSAVPPDVGFDLVVSLSASGAEASPPPDGVEQVVLPLVDTRWVPTDRARLDEAVDAVVSAHAAGRTVLVRCRQGVNRSGLVVGEALARMGHDRDGIVDLVRDRRDPRVLENPRFRAIIEGRAEA